MGHRGEKTEKEKEETIGRKTEKGKEENNFEEEYMARRRKRSKIFCLEEKKNEGRKENI